MKKIPKIFVNTINKKIDNNKEVYYSYLDNKNVSEKKFSNEFDMQNKINNIFKSKNFVYKKKLNIKTRSCQKDYIIISKTYDYLLTMSGEKIYIKDIIDIKE